jgi:hypothetical protein
MVFFLLAGRDEMIPELAFFERSFDDLPAFSIIGRILQSVWVAKSIYSADQESLLKVLARIRSDAGLSQQQLARKMAVSQSTVSDILRGQRRLDVIEWISFCKACKVTPQQFLEELTFLLTRQ